MKGLSLVLFIVLSAFCLAGTEETCAAEKRAVLKVPEKIFDFGSVPQGAKVVHEFEIRNEGNADLQLQRITPSCGCTASTVSSPTVGPGKSEKVRVEFDTAGFSGSKTKTVEILTSDLDNPEILLTVKGVVLPGVTPDPRRIEFGEISPGAGPEAWTRTFSIAVDSGSDLSISAVNAFSKFIKIIPAGAGANGKPSYRVELSKDAPRGELRDRIVVEFRGGRQQPLNIPVTASIKGDLRVVPSTVSFGVLAGKNVLERRVRFENSGAAPVSIKNVTSSQEAVSATIVPAEDGKKGVVIVRVDPAKVRGDLKATLHLETNSAAEPRLTLNVFGVQPPK